MSPSRVMWSLGVLGAVIGFAVAPWLPVRAQSAAPPPESTYVYRSVDGLQIHADVFHPPGDRVTPAILWLHGGALIMGMRHSIRSWELQQYLAHGYTVVAIDYRLAPETKLPQIVDDVEAAYTWMRSQAHALRIDPRRIGVVGHSAGGYLALMCGVVLRPAPAAIVAYYGYGDILGEWYSKPDSVYLEQPHVSASRLDSLTGRSPITQASGPARGSLYVYMRQQGVWTRVVSGLDPQVDAAALRRYCPVLNVTGHFPPTMLLHGTADTDVPYKQSVAMRDALVRAGVTCELVALPGKGHGFDLDQRDPDVLDAIERAQAFLDSRLHPR